MPMKETSQCLLSGKYNLLHSRGSQEIKLPVAQIKQRYFFYRLQGQLNIKASVALPVHHRGEDGGDCSVLPPVLHLRFLRPL